MRVICTRAAGIAANDQKQKGRSSRDRPSYFDLHYQASSLSPYEPREAGNASEFTGLHFLELYCSDCSSKFRLVLQDESASNRACPACGVLAALEIVGHGESNGELPFSQFLHRGPVRLTEEASLGRLYDQEIEQRRSDT